MSVLADRPAVMVGLVVLVGAISAGLVLALPLVASSTLIIAASSVGLALACRRRPELLVPVLTGFVLRIALVFVHLHVYRLPQWADAVQFMRRAHELAELGPVELWQAFGTGSASVPWLSAWLFKLLGTEPIMVQFVMAGLGASLILAVGQLTAVLGGTRRMVMAAAWIMVFLPQPAVHSALQLREVPFSLLFALAVLKYIQWVRSRNPRHAIAGSLLVLAASVFHAGAVFLLVGLLIYSVLSIAQLSDRQRILVGLGSAAVVFASSWFLLQTNYGAEQLGGDYVDVVDHFYVGEQRAPRGGAAYPEWLRIRSPDELWKAPLRLGMFLYAPFPWMVTTERQLLGLIDSILFVIATYLVVRGVGYWRSRGRIQEVRLVLIVLIVAMSVFALGTSNYGTAIRHRAKFSPIVVAVAVAGLGRAALESKGERSANVFPATSQCQQSLGSPWGS